jgi:hypothetical protein
VQTPHDDTIHINKGVWGPSRIRGSGSLVSPPGLHAGTLSPIDVSFILYWLPAPADAARFTACGYAGSLAEVPRSSSPCSFPQIEVWVPSMLFSKEGEAFRRQCVLRTQSVNSWRRRPCTRAAWGVTPPRFFQFSSGDARARDIPPSHPSLGNLTSCHFSSVSCATCCRPLSRGLCYESWGAQAVFNGLRVTTLTVCGTWTVLVSCASP